MNCHRVVSLFQYVVCPLIFTFLLLICFILIGRKVIIGNRKKELGFSTQTLNRQREGTEHFYLSANS